MPHYKAGDKRGKMGAFEKKHGIPPSAVSKKRKKKGATGCQN